MPTCVYARPGYCAYYNKPPKCDEDCSYFFNKEDNEDEDENE